MRIQIACLLLVLLSATVLSQDAKTRLQFKKFINQRINGQMSVNRCDDVMQARNISKINKNKCKKTNTFIRANIDTVKHICGLQESHMVTKKTKSLKPFDIVVCKVKNQRTKYPDCHYSGKVLTRRIIIKCVRGFPVHYDGDIDHCEN